jgi:hypothetical protein
MSFAAEPIERNPCLATVVEDARKTAEGFEPISSRNGWMVAVLEDALAVATLDPIKAPILVELRSGIRGDA